MGPEMSTNVKEMSRASFARPHFWFEHWPALLIPNFSKCPGTFDNHKDDSNRMSSFE